MRPVAPLPRVLVLSLAFATGSSSPALSPPSAAALRVSQEGTGLEELKRQLAPDAGLEETPADFIKRLVQQDLKGLDTVEPSQLNFFLDKATYRERLVQANRMWWLHAHLDTPLRNGVSI